MSDDFPRFNVMPKRPLSVEDTGKNNEWWSGRLGYLPKDHWHEVSDPIEWDGTDEVLGEIARLFPTSTLYPHTHIQGRNAFGDIRIVDYARYPKTGSAGILVLGGRIRIEGDSFVILPPEVTS